MTDQSNAISSGTFSGSYDSDDVEILLKPVDFPAVDVDEKERLLQAGVKHYSEMITRETPPDGEYLSFYFRALENHACRLAGEVVYLAQQIIARQTANDTADIALVSLARAGLPIGVLLKRTLAHLGQECRHYSVSIIRDRGIDTNALDYVRSKHDDESILFVDGWTGKGTIQNELTRAVSAYNSQRDANVSDALCVAAGLSGVAKLSATTDDYLLPFSMLNAVVSGLISRSILSERCVGPDDYHGCLFYEEYKSVDQSRAFVDRVMSEVEKVNGRGSLREPNASIAKRTTIRAREAFLAELMERQGVDDRLKIKPGIGEATRVLLRRVPETLLLRDRDIADVQHLLYLAKARQVKIELRPDMPYNALAIIRSLGGRS